MSRDPYRRIVVDIDGTLCEDTEGKDYAGAKPIQPVIDMVNRYYDAGYHVTIHTARGMYRYRGDVALIEAALRDVTENWLRRNGVKFHTLFFGKPSADLYIDDKGISPDGFAARDPQ